MKFSCDSCHAQYMIADEKVGERGVKVKCKKCSNIIIVKPAAREDAKTTVMSVASELTASPGANPAGGDVGGGFGSVLAAAGATPGGGGFDSGLGAGVVGGAFGGFSAGFGGTGGADTSAAPAPAAAPSPSTFTSDNSEFDLGTLSARVPAPAPARRPAGDKEWYVAIDDAQIGPIDASEIEQRWDARELDEDSLAWKAGMGDWLPVAEIPELAYLITQRPHAKPQARAAAGGAAATAPAGGGGGGGTQSSSYGSAGNDEEITWKPSAASALSSLVQEELVAANTPKPTLDPMGAPAGGSDLEMPAFGASELFARGNGSAGAPGAGAAVRSDPFSAPTPSWSVPVVPHHASGFRWMIPVFSLLGVAILGLLGFLVWQQLRMPQRVVAQAPAQPTPAVAPPATAAQPNAAPAQPVAATPAAAPTAVAAVTPTTEPKTPPVHKPREPREPAKEPTHEPAKEPTHEPAHEKKPPAGDPLEGIDGGGSKAEVKAALTKQDVMDAVKRNAASVGPCLKDARSKGEIEPQQYTFTLDWVIHQDGSVSRTVMKGPAEVMTTSLPSCFATVMKRWTFPASQRELPISNFPFGPINIR